MKKISDSLIYSPPNFDFSKLNFYKKFNFENSKNK